LDELAHAKNKQGNSVGRNQAEEITKEPPRSQSGASWRRLTKGFGAKGS
jgi:hypothetical protein